MNSGGPLNGVDVPQHDAAQKDESCGENLSLIRAVRGAVTFLTRIPLQTDDPTADWSAFRRSPWTYPLVGGLVGSILGLVLFFPVRWPTSVVIYLFVLYLLTGLTHVDGLADLADAVGVHDAERRHEVLQDATTGVGGVLVVAMVLVGLDFAIVGIVTTENIGARSVFSLVLLAEVGAKLGMATLSCLGTSVHDGLGAQVTDEVSPRSLGPPMVVSFVILLVATVGLPVATVITAAVAAIAGPVVALVMLVRTRSWLGGVTGDVLGATNEIARVLGLHLGMVVWFHL